MRRTINFAEAQRALDIEIDRIRMLEVEKVGEPELGLWLPARRS